MGDSPALRATSSSVGARGGFVLFTVDAPAKFTDLSVHYSSCVWLLPASDQETPQIQQLTFLHTSLNVSAII